MRIKNTYVKFAVAIATGVMSWTSSAGIARAHCDTLGGPVLTDAQAALSKGDVISVLKWVKPEYEQEVRKAFQRTMAVRSKGAEARELADQFFFETLVRLHREGEGAPYTGLKPAGTDEGPAIVLSDEALKSGSAAKVIALMTDVTTAGIKARFAEVVELKKHAGDSVEAGRKYVAAYVDYMHYVERLYQGAIGKAGSEESGKDGPAKHEH